MDYQLAAEIQKYERTSMIYNRLDKASVALGMCSICSLVLTCGIMGSACTGVGIAVSIPLGSLACMSATATMVFSLLQKRIAKMKNHRDTLRFAKSTKSIVEQCISTALAYNEQIDDAKSGKITTCLKNYYDEKDQLRQPSTTFSEDLNEHAS